MDKTYTKWYNVEKESFQNTAYSPVFPTFFRAIVTLHKRKNGGLYNVPKFRLSQ